MSYLCLAESYAITKHYGTLQVHMTYLIKTIDIL